MSNNNLKSIGKPIRKGKVILGPPAVGKTYYIRNQLKNNNGKYEWVDMDDIFNNLGLMWHQNESNKTDFILNYKRADYLIEQTIHQGFNLIGALYYEYIPDAIVIPPLSIHQEYLNKRGLKHSGFVESVIKDLREKAQLHSVPIFDCVEDAVQSLSLKP